MTNEIKNESDCEVCYFYNFENFNFIRTANTITIFGIIDTNIYNTRDSRISNQAQKIQILIRKNKIRVLSTGRYAY